MKLIKFTRFGSNFNWRLTIYTRWFIVPWIKILPFKLSEQTKHPKYIGFKAWNIEILPRYF